MSGRGIKKRLLVDPWRTRESFGGVWVIQNYSGNPPRLMDGGSYLMLILALEAFKSYGLRTDRQTDICISRAAFEAENINF